MEGVFEVILYIVVRLRENSEEVLLLVILFVLGDVVDEEGITLALFLDDMVFLEEFVFLVWLLSFVERGVIVEIGEDGVINWEDIWTEVEVVEVSWKLKEEVFVDSILTFEDLMFDLLDVVGDVLCDLEDFEELILVEEKFVNVWSFELTMELWNICSLEVE